MSVAVIDAKALTEFLDKAALYLTESHVERLGQRLSDRRQEAKAKPPEWPLLWTRSPVARRLNGEDLINWKPRLSSLVGPIWAGDTGAVWTRLRQSPSPAWLIEWATFWLHLVRDDLPWWPRWVYQADTETGALALLLTEPAVLKQDSAAACYAVIGDGIRFLEAVLSSTRRWPQVESSDKTWIALASVYGVYMFTMAAWKLTTEFTQVFPPFPTVVANLLGLRRWEGHIRGRESEAD